MKCPACGAAELEHDTHDLPYTYKGNQTVTPAVTADYCPLCHESITESPPPSSLSHLNSPLSSRLVLWHMRRTTLLPRTYAHLVSSFAFSTGKPQRIINKKNLPSMCKLLIFKVKKW